MIFRVGLDVGGTFTDIVVTSAPGAGEAPLRAWYGKTPSIPGAESVAVLNAIRLAAEQYGRSPAEFLATTEVINFGTTVVTNAMLQHRGVPTGMLTTRGFRDILDLRRGYKESLFDIRLPAPLPIVRRRDRVGVTERMGPDGRVLVPLAEEEVAAAVDRLRAAGIVSYAVCFLQAHVNPAHERRAAAIVRERHPEAFVTCSSDVLQQVREFERFSTTAVNAFLSPVLHDYMERLATELREQGFRGRLLVMQSGGGTVQPEFAGRFGVGALLSGPAGGVVAAGEMGRACGTPDVIGVDMGGTSYDVSLIRDATPQMRTDAWIARYRVALPMLDIHTIGAGGGSIAWVDAGGALRVGPQSAGARPGPACYGSGGDQATVTDANLVLGYLNADYFLGGRIPLDHAAAELAVRRRVAEPLGLDVTDAAIGIYRIVNNNMANGIRYVSVARGHDPRDFALMAFGGAAAIHAPVQARDLGIRTILVPKTAAVLCAVGELLADLKVSSMAPYLRLADEADPEEMTRLFAGLAERDVGVVTTRDVLRVEHRCYAELRYAGQVHELSIPIPAERGVVTPDAWKTTLATFHETHERLYTFRLPDLPLEVLTLRLELAGVRPKLLEPVEARAQGEASAHVKARRPVTFPDAAERYRFQDTPVYAGESLQPGHRIAGPAVIEEPQTTVVLYPGDVAELNRFGVYVIAVGADAEARR